LAAGQSPEIGATVGGAQDIAYARTVIANGGIPAAASLTVEGLLSEHDLPVAGTECENLLCIRPALAIAPPPGASALEYWVHLGMLSGLQAPFEAPPIDVVVLIDKSAGMAGDMVQTNHAVSTLVHRLRQQDRIGVLAFDDTVHRIREAGAVGDAAALETDVRAITAGGGVNLLGGLQEAFAMADGFGESDERIRRVIILSCGYPDVGDTSLQSFRTLVEAGAANRIGFTFIGILLGFDYSLADMLSQARGGNYYYTMSLARTETIISDEFDFMMTPLGYDMTLALEIADGFEMERVYGLPGDPGSARSEISVNTIFPSKRRGAILAKLRRADPNELPRAIAEVKLDYTPEPALGWGGPVTQELAVTSSASDDGNPYWGSPGARKAVALVHQIEGMQRAIALQATDRDAAISELDALADHLESEATALDADEGLKAEASLVRALADNL
jgi:Ca-activated chloride channel homolog